jgi:nucleotide-binding universal stress UspA family protein
MRVPAPVPITVTEEARLGLLYPDQAAVAAQRTAERYLTGLPCAADDLTVMREIREGEVAGEVVDAAREAQAGLIVMASHGNSGVRRWLLGSVAEKVLNAAPCPVWVVREPVPPQHLLITLDGSPLAEAALPPAFAIARCFGAQVTLLRVVSEMSVVGANTLDDLERGLGQRFLDEMVESAAVYLNQIARQFSDELLEPEIAVRSGPAAETILNFANRHDIDLVAMATHGHTGLKRWIYGSVMHKVLDQLPTSMLITRSFAIDDD